MNYKSKYKRMFIESLIKDKEYWQSVTSSQIGTEYISKVYGTEKDNNRIVFCVDNYNFGVCIYVNGMIQVQLTAYPFTKFKRAIKDMKKYVDDKNSKNHNNELESIIDSHRREN